MYFKINAYDGTDKDALSRRKNARPRHLQNMIRVMQTYSIPCAGGILNDEGTPIGSYLIMEFPSREDLDKYLENEPYVTEKVWEKIEIEICNPVIVDSEMRE
ncbi:MAG: hypothetical protein E7228_04850 [Clostridiales bacterium]|nr:hypothetical protein [Clostridiales bacterium]